jgi:glucokinase
MSDCVISIDLGGTKILSALADINGDIIAIEKGKSTLYKDSSIEKVALIIEELIKKAPQQDKIKAIGIAVPEIKYKLKEQIVPYRMVLKKFLEKRFKIPSFAVNDGTCGAWGEFALGAGKNSQNMIYLCFGTGVGGGIIIDGKIYAGKDEVAGEFGHMSINFNGPVCGCGNKGCFHLYASGESMAGLAKNLMDKEKQETLLKNFADTELTFEKIKDCAVKNDETALKIIRYWEKIVGLGISNIINVFNPDRIVLGGGMFLNNAEILLENIRNITHQQTAALLPKSTEIVCASLGEKSVLQGMINLLINKF